MPVIFNIFVLCLTMAEPNTKSPLLDSTDPKKFNEPITKAQSTPVVPLLMNNSAPLAKDEVDEIDADHHINSVPLATFPGIDDGFFDERYSDSNKIPEIALTVPSTPDTAEIPHIGFRFGEDDNDSTQKGDEVDSKNGDDKALKVNRNLLNPSPHFGMDFETMSTMGAGDSSIPDVNIYQHKKTLAQGMMDLALFSANANQLRYVVESSSHPYYYPSMIMITFSLLLQVSNFIPYILCVFKVTLT